MVEGRMLKFFTDNKPLIFFHSNGVLVMAVLTNKDSLILLANFWLIFEMMGAQRIR